MKKVDFGFSKSFVAYWNIPVDDNGGQYGGGYGGSRDYMLPTIPCDVKVCPCNKKGKCEMPSAIKINASGACKMGITAIEMEKRENRSSDDRLGK